MILVTFNYKDKKYFFKNIFIFYTLSFVLGGLLYSLNIHFSYKQIGLVFIYKNLSINIIFLSIFSPLALYIYIRNQKSINNDKISFKKVDIYYKNNIYHLNGYLDTGNKLNDPYKNRPISIWYNKDFVIDKPLYIPYQTINKRGVLNCIVVDKMIIDKDVYIKPLIGISNEEFFIDGMDIILHSNYK